MKFLFLQQNIIEKQTKKYSLFSKMAGSIPGNIGYSCTYKEKKGKFINRGNMRSGTGLKKTASIFRELFLVFLRYFTKKY